MSLRALIRVNNQRGGQTWEHSLLQCPTNTISSSMQEGGGREFLQDEVCMEIDHMHSDHADMA